jgi:diaminopimelate decarboxylase
VISPLDDETRAILEKIGRERGTPCYVYFVDRVRAEITRVEQVFKCGFIVSYAIKCNSNLKLLASLRPSLGFLDVSSGGELDRALDAQYLPSQITFSGPAKRLFELKRAVELKSVLMVCESGDEIEQLDKLAMQHGVTVPFLIRINPKVVPAKFGAHMGGQSSQFGIDEETVSFVMDSVPSKKNLVFRGFHIYSGSNCLDEQAIAENFRIFAEIFIRFKGHSGLTPEVLIIGSGFGIPYYDEQVPLNLEQLASLVNPLINDLRGQFKQTQFILEMGRFLIGPHGYLLTSIIGQKESRGRSYCICDAGMNNHLAACGLMGMVIRRNFPIWRISNEKTSSMREYTLVGPLCTSIDLLAQRITLPLLQTGDLIAVGASGAYAAVCSPLQFISHPRPTEFLVEGCSIVDATPA